MIGKLLFTLIEVVKVFELIGGWNCWYDWLGGIWDGKGLGGTNIFDAVVSIADGGVNGAWVCGEVKKVGGWFIGVVFTMLS